MHSPRLLVETKVTYMLPVYLEITIAIFLSTEKDKPSQNLLLELDIWICLCQYFQEIKRCVKEKKKCLPEWTLLNIVIEELGLQYLVHPVYKHKTLMCHCLFLINQFINLLGHFLLCCEQLFG